MNNAPVQWQEIMDHLKSVQGDSTADVETIIESLSQHQDLTRWIIGDVLLHVGTSKQNIDHYSKIARCKESTLRSWLTTAKIWNPELRWQLIDDYPSLSFALFKECNSIANDDDLGIDVAIETLELAGRELYTVKQLKFYITTELKQQDKKEFELIADSTGIVWINPALETINIELGDELASYLVTGKSYRIKIYEELDNE